MARLPACTVLDFISPSEYAALPRPFFRSTFAPKQNALRCPFPCSPRLRFQENAVLLCPLTPLAAVLDSPQLRFEATNFAKKRLPRLTSVRSKWSLEDWLPLRRVHEVTRYFGITNGRNSKQSEWKDAAFMKGGNFANRFRSREKESREASLLRSVKKGDRVLNATTRGVTPRETQLSRDF